MNELLSFAIIGLVTGAAYAVAASGLVVTYSTSGIFNIAHGAIGMFMAFTYWQLRVAWHLPAPLALLLVIGVGAPAFGAGVEFLLIRRLRDRSTATTLVVTIGLMVGLIGLVNTIWKPQARILEPFFGHRGFRLAGVFVTFNDVITLVVAAGIAIGLRLLLYRTRIGVSMRAVVDDQELAGLNGARPPWVSTASWALGSTLASVAGILIAPTLQLSVLPLTLLVVDAYAAAMVGRLRNLPLTFAASIGIGLAQSLAVGYMPSTGVFGTTPLQGLRLSIPALLLFATLLLLPEDSVGGTLALRRAAPRAPTLVRSLEGAVSLVAAVFVATRLIPAGDVTRLGTGLALAVVMLSLVPLTGWGGQVSLCQMTFAGLGAFAMSRVGGGSVLGLAAAMGLAAVVGVVVALPALRLRGLYLALATMAFGAAMDNMVFPASTVFTFNGSVHVPRLHVAGLDVSDPRVFTVVVAGVFGLAGVVLLVLRRGPAGRLLAAMKDSEAACTTLGLSLTTTKLAVFTASASVAGLGGALYGGVSRVAGATEFEMLASLPILLLVVVGGISTVCGALAGGVTLGLLPLVQNVFPSLSSASLLGSGLAGITLGSNPDGIVPGLVARARRLVESVPLRGWRERGAGAYPSPTMVSGRTTSSNSAAVR